MKIVLSLLIPLALSFGAERTVEVQELSGRPVSFDLTGKTTVVMFYSATCPVSNDYNDRMSALYRAYSQQGVQLIFVNANANEPARDVALHAKAADFPFPVYKDANNVLADSMGATVTPEAYLFDRDGVVRYHGHIDDSRNPARAQVHGLRKALDAVLTGVPVAKQETKAFGCTIKRVRKAS